jgi:hypothetical protein
MWVIWKILGLIVFILDRWWVKKKHERRVEKRDVAKKDPAHSFSEHFGGGLHGGKPGNNAATTNETESGDGAQPERRERDLFG